MQLRTSCSRLGLFTSTLLFAACSGSGGSSSSNSAQAGPVAEFAQATTSVAENFGTVNISISLSEPATEEVRIPFTLSGTAAEGADYNALASPLTIAVGDSAASVFIDVVDDTDNETGETVVVTLGELEGAQLGNQSAHTLTILESDLPVPEVEDNDGVVDSVNNGHFGELVPGAFVRLGGHIFSEVDLADAETDRVDTFSFDVPEDVNVSVTVNPLGNADLSLLLGGPSGNALIPGEGIANSSPAGQSESFSLNIPGGEEFYVAVFGIENDGQYELEIQASTATAPATGGDIPTTTPAQIASPELRSWLEQNGLQPEAPQAAQRRQG